MNAALYSINHKVISWMVVLLMMVGGVISFTSLGQLEQPEFTIKTALVITNYPGASSEQVEEEVTLPLEDAIQQMSQIKHITSINSAGLSQIEVEISDQYDKHSLPQVWDELRRKVNDTQGTMPTGVSPSVIVDDFSDVYGYLLNLTGKDYSYRELHNFSNLLRRELVLIPGVKKVSVSGIPQEIVVVEISQQKLAALGLEPDYIYGLLQTQNVVSNAGKMLVGDYRIRIHPTGEFVDITEMKNILVSPADSQRLIYLGDIANVYRTTTEAPSQIYHNNGEKALSVGISYSSGVNVVDISRAISQHLESLSSEIPVGMQLNVIYDQGSIVDKSVSGFIINLAQSVAIVILVLLVFMGLKSGLLMGAVLTITILGTFIVMNVFGIQLQNVSLGALIIALGMLVDNAIVVTEGIIIGIKKGLSRREAASRIVKQSQGPLLGATIIAIMAFAPIGLSSDATGEFCASLFQVLLISLSISWLTAITITPFFCYLLFKDGDKNNAEENPYNGVIFNIYDKILSSAMRYRFLSLITVFLMLIAAVVGMTKVKSVFFPASTTPIFMVDIWMPEGTDILSTETLVKRIERDLLPIYDEHGIVNITSVTGQGAQRFALTYQPEKTYAAYAQLLLEMRDLENLAQFLPWLEQYLRDTYPEAEYRVKKMENGPSPAAKIEARLYGDDPIILRKLAEHVKVIFDQESDADNIRNTWRNQSLFIRPQIDLARSREIGISKQDLDTALLRNFNGQQIGIYRDGSHLLPIIARSPANERKQANSLNELQVWSSKYRDFTPITQLISHFTSEWENPIIMRRDRKRVITVLADPATYSHETADSLLKKVRHKVEALELPAGYTLEWGGEFEISSEAQQGLASSIPMGYLAMFLITVLLFNSLRQPIVIWLTVPLAVIGVAFGLLVLDAPLSFMAIIGMLSLSGMIIKNSIVLVDQINVELKDGKPPYQAVYQSAVSRVRPVGMAALTTMLGMVPLLSDPFFQSMAVTIVFGLGFATVLTLVVLPVIYTIIYQIKVEYFVTS
ncbi:AcrB/AcrD/AcrF family protein [Vibrio sp. V27_P1S3P104]|nr:MULTISPECIES: efflux RND transporter permease subunit [unclassified Vibrio]NAW68470.1 AcrB/AcrD/AcrF family protein [Vibrio sp. V28_P6S34P95]NAX05820.1 AcrB/AcrD/AcrF family protein [Vibrio sp. V30_P3S12P165]NAX36740.1 AcrB/AcrD/AcrF family protein [Vibrio sp. V27_P1S3P104]